MKLYKCRFAAIYRSFVSPNCAPKKYLVQLLVIPKRKSATPFILYCIMHKKSSCFHTIGSGCFMLISFQKFLSDPVAASSPLHVRQFKRSRRTEKEACQIALVRLFPVIVFIQAYYSTFREKKQEKSSLFYSRKVFFYIEKTPTFATICNYH